jgi:hypothetical protein
VNNRLVISIIEVVEQIAKSLWGKSREKAYDPKDLGSAYYTNLPSKNKKRLLGAF